MEKKLSDITRSEWVAFDWVEIDQSFDDNDRVFMAETRRTPNEAAQAALDWDSTIDEREATKDIEL